MLKPTSSHWSQIYLSVALTTLATLLLELSLTRVFSVVFYYHLAFMAISIALFGLGAGGVFSYCQHDWSSIWDDPEMTLTARILARARANGMRIATYAADCAERSGSSRADPLATSGVPEPTG